MLLKRQLVLRVQKRFASQEVNPIIYRLQYNNPDSPIAFDRHATRSWMQTFYAPHKEWGMWFSYQPFMTQGLRMKAFLDGYFKNKMLLAEPLIYRSMAGNLVRLFVYNPTRMNVDWDDLQENLSYIFSQFQGPGTSGAERVPVKLDIIDLKNPVLNASVLAQFVAMKLEKNFSSTAIFDEIAQSCGDIVSKRASEGGASGLNVAGFRLQIKGRPKGEEMAVKHDFLHGSCPKRRVNALMDYGKHSVIMRSGAVGVKAWVHFQRPSYEDETGKRERLAEFTNGSGEQTESSKTENEEEKMPFPSLLGLDRDYSSKESIPKPNIQAKGLWNVESVQDPEITQLAECLRTLHTPVNTDKSRFIW